MPLRTVSNTGGNWNATTAWVGGVVPIAGDTIDFTPTSGNLTVNVSTANLVGINFTNYVGIITFNNPINTNGTVNLGTGGYTQDGASGLVINGSTTISGSTTWSRTFTISITSTTTITLSSNLNITGTTTLTHAGAGSITLSFSGVGTLNPSGSLTINNNSSSNFSFTITIPNSLNITNLTLTTGFINNVHSIIFNGNLININGNLSISGTGNLTIGGTTNLNLTGTGTWSNSGANYIQNNLTINSPIGTITISGSVYYRTGTLTYTSGTTIITTGSTLNINASSTLDTSGMTWNNVILSGTQTLTSGLNIGGNLTTQSTAVVLSGVVNVNVSGSLTINTTTSGTAAIILNGTGTWSATSYLSNNLTINSPSGTITISGNVYYNTGTITHTTGTVNTTTNNSTLNINTSITLDTSGITWNNITILLQSNTNINITLSSNLNITGTTTFTHASAGNLTLSFSGVGSLNSSGALTINNNSTSNWSFTITIPISLTITNLTLATGFINNVHSIILNSNSININGNLLISGTGNFIISGTTNLNLTGTGTWSHTGASQLRNNLTINSPSGTITISGNVYYNTGTLTYTIGTITTTGSTLNISASTTLNCGNMNGVTTNKWNNVTLSGTSQTFTLTSNLSLSGTLLLSGTTAMTFTGNTLNVGGNLTLNSTAIVSGTTSIVFNGTGTWSHTVTGVIRNNITINTAGTLTIGTNIYYNTGTLTYTTGTVNTTTNNSILNCSLSTTFNTSGMTWNAILITGTTTIILSSNLNTTNLTASSATVSFTLNGFNLNITNTLSLSTFGATTFNTPQNLQVTNLALGAGVTSNITINGLFNISVSGNLIENHSTTTIAGTTSIILNGTGTWSNASSGGLQYNLTINTSGTITVSGNVYYNTGTLTYTAGTVITTGSTLNVSLNTTLNTNTLNWTNVTFIPGTFATITITLTSNLNVLSNLLHVQNTGFIIINGLFNINVSGNLSTGAIVSGTSTHVLNGTGTISTGNFFRTSLTINTAGTITISGNFFFSTGTLTYVTGTVVYTSTATLYLNLSSTLNVGNLTWPIVYINGGGTITLSSNLVTNDFTANQGVINWVTGGNLLIVNNNMIVGSDQYPSGGGTTTLTIPNELKVKNLTLNTTAFNSTSGIYPTTVNGSAIYVQGNLTIGNYSYTTNPIAGTTNIILIGTGTFTMPSASQASLNNNLTFNTGGNIILSGNIFYNTGTLTYLSGNIITKNTTFTISLATTLINCHKINFDRVVITSGINITMNEFFSGSPLLKTTITPSSTTNYIITFQDRFEKFSKFVKVSRATVSTPGQLTVTTDKGNQLNNVGVKFAPNQITNSLPKNSPSTNSISPNGLSPTYLVTDPTLS